MVQLRSSPTPPPRATPNRRRLNGNRPTAATTVNSRRTLPPRDSARVQKCAAALNEERPHPDKPGPRRAAPTPLARLPRPFLEIVEFVAIFIGTFWEN